MADDDESLDEILSSKNTTPEITTEAPDATAPARDEHGRFAPKQETGEPESVEEQAETPAEPETEPEHNAPVAAVIAERRKAQAANERADKLERDIAELRTVLMERGAAQPAPTPQPTEPVKPPDFWEAPDKFVEHALNPFQQQMAEMTFRTSRAEALAEFGKDAVIAANDAIKQAIQSGQLDGNAVAANLQKSRDPVGDVVRWHQSSPAVQEKTMREKIEAEVLAKYGIDPTKNNAPNPSTPSTRDPVVKMPPSLSRIPAGHSAPERDESLDEVLSAPRRRA